MHMKSTSFASENYNRTFHNKSIKKFTHMKSINNLPQWKYKQTFPNKIIKKSHRSGRRGIIVHTYLGLLSCGRFISWSAFVHLFEE